jgi:hypothetical protein
VRLRQFWANAKANKSGDFVGTSYCGASSNNPYPCLTNTDKGAGFAPAPGGYRITVMAGGIKASFRITIKAGNSNVTGESGLFSFPRTISGKAGTNVTVFYNECNTIKDPNGSSSVLSPGCSSLYTANGEVSGTMCGASFQIAATATTNPWPQYALTKASPNKISYPIPNSCKTGTDHAELTIGKGNGNDTITFKFAIKVS